MSSLPPPIPAAPAQSPNPNQWFASEVHPHDGQLKAWLRSSFPSVRDVDDVVQESYLRIWRARAVQPIQSAKAFLFRVARHLALDTLRKNRNSPADSGCDFAASRVLDTAPDAAQALLDRELFDHVINALIALPPRHRDVIVLHKLKGLSHREVAAQLGLTERTAQKYCSLGLEQCARHLETRGIHRFFN